MAQLPLKRENGTELAQEQTKGKVLFFTCLTFTAIHLELAGDLSTDCFILVLQRFTSRRGNPRSMWSDNGQNFFGANQELKFLLKP